MKSALALLLAVLGLASVAISEAHAQNDAGPYLRHPAVSPDGQTVAFSYQGDLWTVPSAGGRAYRLTVHEAYEGHPRWSPEGDRIAFTSDRNGNDDVFVMRASGSRPERLTYHSAADRLGGWTHDDGIVFETSRTYVQAEWAREFQRVGASGGTPTRIMDALGYAPSPSPTGRFIAYERGANGTQRKRYRGPANRDLWLYDTQARTFTQLTDFDGNDFGAAWVGENALLFISERGGAYNLYRMTLGADGAPQGEPEQLTRFAEYGPHTVSASRDGSVIAFEREADVYVMRDGGTPQILRAEVPDDYRFDPTETLTETNGAGEYAVSPDGEHIAFVMRGEVFLIRNDPEGKRTVRLTDHAFRDRDVAWLNDEALIFASDREGQYELYRLESADPAEPSLYKSLRHRAVRLTNTPEDERNPVVSPDTQHVAFQRGRGMLMVASLDDGSLRDERALLDGWATPGGVAWSPDSRHLAYSLADLSFNTEVFIHPLAPGSTPTNVSQHPRPDYSPVWSPDGSKLGFISSRNSGDNDVWFAWLREADWQRTQSDWDDLGEDGEDAKADTTDAPLVIDFDGLYERLVQVTALPGNESEPVFTEDGEHVFFVAGRGGRTQQYRTDIDLYRTQWDGSEQKAITSGGARPYGLSLAPSGKHVHYMRSGGRLARADAKSGKTESLGFRARMTVDHTAERAQVFDEAWRALADGFYDPNYHGVDWEAMRDLYRPWALRASTERDFRDTFNRMLGELNASHLGLRGPNRAETQRERTGLLGVEIEPVASGVRIIRVVPDSPADRQTSKLAAGETITHIDGRAIADAPNVYALLEGTADERVLLRVTDAGGAARDVVIRPTRSLGDALYAEWVEERRRLTEQYSGGRLGYIHIEGMNWQSFERFERELTASGNGKEGLVVDVRFNGGGWTTDYLLSVLTVRRHAYTVPRGAAADLERQQGDFKGYYPAGERLPFASWTQHVAALCNANSYSNAEIFSHAFKHLGLGPLVGEPTFGAVISTGGVGLMNGSFVRLPFRGWYVYETGENMENIPAVPTLLVDNAPDSRARGEDEQLRAAVRALLDDIAAGRPARSGLSNPGGR